MHPTIAKDQGKSDSIHARIRSIWAVTGLPIFGSQELGPCLLRCVTPRLSASQSGWPSEFSSPGAGKPHSSYDDHSFRLTAAQSRGRRRSGLGGLTAALLLGFAALFTTPAQAQPIVSITADQTNAVFMRDNVSFTVSRTGSTTEELDVAVTLTQDKNFLEASLLSKTVTIPANATGATLHIYSSEFGFAAGNAVGKGRLTATVQDGTDYDVGTSSSAGVDIIVALTFGFEFDTYMVGEADGTLSVKVIARTGEDAAVPTVNSSVTVLSRRGGAEVNVDYVAFSATLRFEPGDFVATGSVFKAEKTLTVTILDDGNDDDNETFGLELGAHPGLRLHYRNFVFNGNSCGSVCLATVTIIDNDEDNDEATERAAVVPPLTARFGDVPTGHDGSTAFTLQLAFNESIRTTAEQLQQALTVTGGTVTSVRMLDGRSDLWEIILTPNSDDAVRISLPPTTSCDDDNAICTAKERRLSQGIAVSIPRAPLTARFEQVPSGHHGTTAFALQLAFSESVETTAAALEQALTVTNATVTSVQQVDDRSDLWQITVTPDSNAEVRLSLPQTTSCDDDNAVCTAGGQKLSAGIAASIPRTALTAGFEQVPEEHIGIPFNPATGVQRTDWDDRRLGADAGADGDRRHRDQRTAGGRPTRPVGNPDTTQRRRCERIPTKDHLVRRRGCHLHPRRRGAAQRRTGRHPLLRIPHAPHAGQRPLGRTKQDRLALN